LEDVGKTPNLIAAMRKRGFTAEQVSKVMGANALRVMQKAESAAAQRG
ncbi:MAG: membrane dipeptidase, partial [Acidobacteriaceae bacterium]|nr:membrane dipeptidase [Acidobacteriaceae bacterium]